MQEDLMSLAIEFGLKREEIDHLQKDELTTYFNHFHGKSTKISSLLVYGFSEKERKEISESAKLSNFLLVGKPHEFVFSDTNRVAFICTNDLSIIESARYYGATILRKEFFEKFHSAFFTEKIHEVNFDFLFNKLVPIDYSVAIPLSNYNKPFFVESFSRFASFDFEDNSPQNQITYTVNLYRNTCTCKDFLETNRSELPVGDVRRLCKHLIRKYTQVIGTNGLSNVSKCVLLEGYGLKRNFHHVQIDGVTLPVAINYKDADSMWNIFFPNKEGTYKRYGYFPDDETFYYDEKPVGYVKPLRIKLKDLRNKLKGKDSVPNPNSRKAEATPTNRTNTEYTQQPKEEYPSFTFFIVVLMLLIWLFGC